MSLTATTAAASSAYEPEYMRALGGLDGIDDVIPKLYAVEMQAKFCMACSQLAGDHTTAVSRSAWLWLADAPPDSTDTEDPYAKYVIAYVQERVRRLAVDEYDGVGVPEELQMVSCCTSPSYHHCYGLLLSSSLAAIKSLVAARSELS